MALDEERGVSVDLYAETRRLLGLPPPEPPPDPSRFDAMRERLADVVAETLAACDLTTAAGNLLADVLTRGRAASLRKIDELERRERKTTSPKVA